MDQDNIIKRIDDYNLELEVLTSLYYTQGNDNNNDITMKLNAKIKQISLEIDSYKKVEGNDGSSTLKLTDVLLAFKNTHEQILSEKKINNVKDEVKTAQESMYKIIDEMSKLTKETTIEQYEELRNQIIQIIRELSKLKTKAEKELTSEIDKDSIVKDVIGLQQNIADVEYNFRQKYEKELDLRDKALNAINKIQVENTKNKLEQFSDNLYIQISCVPSFLLSLE